MEIKLALTVDSDTHDMDMHYGLQTLKGTSDVASKIAESLLRKSVPSKITHKNPVRTKLKYSVKGSFKQNFSINVEDPFLVKQANKIGKEAIAEVISYYIYEALHFHIDADDLSLSAQQEIEKMDHLRDDLIVRLRESLKEMHQVSKYYDHKMTLSYLKPKDPKVIAQLNKNTSIHLTETKLVKAKVEIDAVINRYNTFTGTGRLLIKGQNETVPFSFASDVHAVRAEIKKVISKNLDINNAVKNDNFQYTKFIVTKAIRPATKEVVKYFIAGVS